MGSTKRLITNVIPFEETHPWPLIKASTPGRLRYIQSDSVEILQQAYLLSQAYSAAI